MTVVIATRDSVCAGDDAEAPHERRFEIESALHDTSDFIRQTTAGYLASVNGVGHSWDAHLNGELIAVITVGGIHPKVPTANFDAENTLHFNYNPADY